MKLKIPRPFKILKEQFKYIQRQNPQYSMRALARDLKLAPSFVSEILNGKRSIPKSRLSSFKNVLKMDDIKSTLLDHSLAQEIKMKFPQIENIKNEKNIPPVWEYTEMVSKQFPLLSHWINIALMDLVTCSNFDPNPDVIARRLQITKNEAIDAFNLLVRMEFIKQENGRWIKSSKKIKFPTRQSMPIVRELHSQLIKLALKKLQVETTDKDFQNRLINGFVFAGNPKKFTAARSKLNEALFEVVEMLSEGECSEVYQLNVQFLPITQ